MDHVKEWTSLPVPDLLLQKSWKRISTESFLMSPDDPIGLKD